MKLIQECKCGGRIEVEGEVLEVYRIMDMFTAAHFICLQED